jgi:hypothetical protein
MVLRIAFVNAEGTSQEGRVGVRNFKHDELARFYFGGNGRAVNL